MHYSFTATLLCLFWLVLSGHFTPFLLLLGLSSALLVTWLLYRMDQVDGEPSGLRPTPRLLGYAVWLLGRVIVSSLDVARRIWDPALPVSPVWARIDTSVQTPLEKAIYASSITLTPGTLTTDVEKGYFLVHALTRDEILDLRRGEMERRIRRLGV